MHPFLRSAAVLAALMISAAAPSGAFAQAYPPAGIPGAPQGDVPGGPQSAAAQSVRIDRLENRVRELTGQVEELQFQTRRMEQQMQKFQQDVDFRFQERGGAAAPARAQQPRRSEVRPPATAQAQPQDLPGDAPDDQPENPRQQAGLEPAPGGGAGLRSGDVFDPNQNPAAPGAPRALNPNPGPYVPSAAPRPSLPGGPLDPGGSTGAGNIEDPNAPLDLTRPGSGRTPRPLPPTPAVAASNSTGVLPGVPGQVMTPGGAAAPPAAAPAQNRYQIALVAIKENRFDEAEQDLRAFIDQNPKSRTVPDALFNLGQTYEKRGRHREAAEQYLKVTQEHEKSARAPESMLRLGLSLERLGVREQACATWQEAGRKYPLAPNYVRTSLEQQQKRAKC